MKISKKDKIIKKHLIGLIQSANNVDQINFLKIYPIFRLNQISIIDEWIKVYTTIANKHSTHSKNRKNCLNFIKNGLEKDLIPANKRDLTRILNILLIKREKPETIEYFKKIQIRETKSDSYVDLYHGNLLRTKSEFVIKLKKEDTLQQNTLHKSYSNRSLYSSKSVKSLPSVKRKISTNKNISNSDNLTSELDNINASVLKINPINNYQIQLKDIINELNIEWYKYYNRITIQEFINAVTLPEENKYFTNLHKLDTYFKQINYMIPNEILKNPLKKDQTKLISRFVKLAKYAKRSNNFFLYMAIYLGLKNQAIQRIKFLWTKQKYNKKIQKMETFWEPALNYKNYRSQLDKVSYLDFCIPHLIIFKKEIIHLLEVPIIDDNEINHDLCNNALKIVKLLERFQNSDSNILNSSNPNLKRLILPFFKNLKTLEEEENEKLFNFSQAIFKNESNLSGNLTLQRSRSVKETRNNRISKNSNLFNSTIIQEDYQIVINPLYNQTLPENLSFLSQNFNIVTPQYSSKNKYIINIKDSTSQDYDTNNDPDKTSEEVTSNSSQEVDISDLINKKVSGSFNITSEIIDAHAPINAKYNPPKTLETKSKSTELKRTSSAIFEKPFKSRRNRKTRNLALKSTRSNYIF